MHVTHTSMRVALFFFILTVLLAGSAAAQSHGYAFIAPGGSTSSGFTTGTYHMGVGGDYVSKYGIGFEAEVGYLSFTESRFQDGFGLGSVNGSYHFRQHSRVVPFVTGGYTLAFRSGTANLANFGGGVNWWFHRRLGLKIELRDHVDVQSRANLNLWGARFGLTFR